MVGLIAILDAHSGQLVRGPELFARGLAFEETAEDLSESLSRVTRVAARSARRPQKSNAIFLFLMDIYLLLLFIL